MNRVVHFEIQADEPQRAIEFYAKVFGWNIQLWAGLDYDYWAVMTADKDSKEAGIHGGLLKRTAKAPEGDYGANSFVCTIQVENFDDIAKKIAEAGGKVATPKYALKGMAWQGYFVDTEGNTFGIHQPDLAAK